MRIPVVVTVCLAGAVLAVAFLWRQVRMEDRRTADPAAPRAINASGPATQAEHPASALHEAATSTMPSVDARAPGSQGKEQRHAAALASWRKIILSRDPYLARDLRLSEAQADALLGILAEGYIRKQELTGVVNAIADSTLPQEVQQRQDEAIAALLGPTMFADYQEYNRNFVPRTMARTQAGEVAYLMKQEGVPLSEAQEDSLRSLLAAQLLWRQQAQNAGNPQGYDENDRRQQLEAEDERRVMLAASGFMDSRQVAVLQKRGTTESRKTAALQRQQQMMEDVRKQAQAAKDLMFERMRTLPGQ